MKVEIELIRENRNRQFYTVRANDMLICTYIWKKPLAEAIAAAITEYAANHGEDSILTPLQLQEL